MKTIAQLIALTAIAASAVFAQTPDSLSPKNPMLPRAPAFASWTVTFKYAADENQTTPDAPKRYLGDAVRSVTISKTESVYREQVSLASGKVCERWQFGGLQLASATDSKTVFVVLPPKREFPDPTYYDYAESDFPELSWVSKKHYLRVEKFDGKPAFLFESSTEGKTLKALLSTETQFPLSFSDGDSTRIYTMNSPPLAPLSPPQNFMDAFVRYKRAQEALNYRPGLP